MWKKTFSDAPGLYCITQSVEDKLIKLNSHDFAFIINWTSPSQGNWAIYFDDFVYLVVYYLPNIFMAEESRIAFSFQPIFLTGM